MIMIFIKDFSPGFYLKGNSSIVQAIATSIQYAINAIILYMKYYANSAD